MTDYKNLKLIATSSPHIRGKITTRGLMTDVIIALIPRSEEHTSELQSPS